MERRQLGQTDIRIAPVAMGCWPISGITSINVNERDSLATLATALDAGINHFDTAFCYGYEGESERMIARENHDERLLCCQLVFKIGPLLPAEKSDIKSSALEVVCKHCGMVA
jgi:aryl-alcohol dehydrogenase-like predicted oxidoreductase